MSVHLHCQIIMYSVREWSPNFLSPRSLSTALIKGKIFLSKSWEKKTAQTVLPTWGILFRLIVFKSYEMLCFTNPILRSQYCHWIVYQSGQIQIWYCACSSLLSTGNGKNIIKHQKRFGALYSKSSEAIP